MGAGEGERASEGTGRDEETRRRGDEETRRRGDEETRRQGDKEKRKERRNNPMKSYVVGGGCQTAALNTSSTWEAER